MTEEKQNWKVLEEGQIVGFAEGKGQWVVETACTLTPFAPEEWDGDDEAPLPVVGMWVIHVAAPDPAEDEGTNREFWTKRPKTKDEYIEDLEAKIVELEASLKLASAKTPTIHK